MCESGRYQLRPGGTVGDFEELYPKILVSKILISVAPVSFREEGF